MLVILKELIPDTLKKLQRVAIFSQVKVEEKQANLWGFSLAKTKKTNFLPDKINACTRLPIGIACHIIKNFYLLISEAQASTIIDFLREQKIEQQLGNLAWHHAMLLANRFYLYQLTQKQFLPSTFKLIEQGAVSVKKGCYIGQEIISRLYFLGKDKYHTVIIKSKELLGQPGDSIQVDETKVGEIIDVCPSKNQYALYACTLLKNQTDKTLNYFEATVIA